MTGIPFSGKILIEGHSALDASPFKETAWSNDVATLPAQNPSAWKETNFSNDNNNAEPNVLGFLIVEDEWS